MNAFTAFLTGLLFGIGLIVSGMTDPSKIIGFLDLTGAWDPSLALVMAGAVPVSALGFYLARKRVVTVLGGLLQVPEGGQIDRRLLLGSVTFGVGWGLAGFCPGPALVASGAGQDKAMVFLVAMLAGMALYELAERLMRNQRRSPVSVADGSDY
jgi:uncharacterized membrane protein YedE/YeeE